MVLLEYLVGIVARFFYVLGLSLDFFINFD